MFLRCHMPLQLFVPLAQLLCVAALTVNSLGCPAPNLLQLNDAASAGDADRAPAASTQAISSPAPVFSLPASASESFSSHQALPLRPLLDQPTFTAKQNPAADNPPAENPAAEQSPVAEQGTAGESVRLAGQARSSEQAAGGLDTESSLAIEDAGEEATATDETTAAVPIAESEQADTLQKEAALAAIFELRRQRGSILAGTLLGEEPSIGPDADTDRGPPSERPDASFAETLRQLSGLPPQPLLQPSRAALAAPHANDGPTPAPIPNSNTVAITDHTTLAAALRLAATQLRRGISEPDQATLRSLTQADPRQARYRALADLLEAEAAMLLPPPHQIETKEQPPSK